MKNIDMAAVARVSSRVELVSIRLTQINAVAYQNVESGLPLEPTFQHECSPVSFKDGFIDVSCSYKFQVKTDGVAVADANLAYNVLYKLKGEAPVQDSDLVQFASANGAYHSWPFVRETIYGLTSRMGFPPYTLPVLSFLPNKETTKPSSQADTQETNPTSDQKTPS